MFFLQKKIVLFVRTMSKYFILIICFIFLSPSSSKLFKKSRLSDKLKIELFTESLCPYCIAFLTTSFKTAINTKGIELLADFSIYPYGNAYQSLFDKKWKFKCQHGTKECYGNLMQNCVLHHTTFRTGIDFILCFEENVGSFHEDIDEIGQHCAGVLNIDFNEIKNCINTDMGNHIQHEVATKTEALRPPRRHVPWIVVNSQHNSKIEKQIKENMLGYICKNYQGNVKIEACLPK